MPNHFYTDYISTFTYRYHQLSTYVNSLITPNLTLLFSDQQMNYEQIYIHGYYIG